MEEIIFESHPGFIILCLALAAGYAALLYRVKNPWSKTLNWILFSLRAVLVFILAFLLLSPVIKQINNIFEKPVFVILQDNSISIKETTDSVLRNSLVSTITNLRSQLDEKGNEATLKDLSGNNVENIKFEYTNSDIQGALRKIINQYEGRSITGVLLISDGVYNSGLSPLFGQYNFPVYALGVGDTTQRQDIALKELIYNKIAYEGNKFPLRAEILVKGFPNQNISVSLLKGGKVIEQQTKNSGEGQLLVVEFAPSATEQGIQRYDVRVEIKKGESSVRNNQSAAFVEVVEGKKKILVVASSPHPDIKAIRAVVESNPNYDFLLHIPGIQEVESKYLQPQNIDLAVFHQAPDKRGRTRSLFQQFVNSKTSLFVVIGQQTELNVVTQNQLPLKFEQPPRQFDDVMPVINTGFVNFSVSSDANTAFANFPPVWVPFAKMEIPASSSVLLFQKVGSLATDKPLLWVDDQDNHKIAIMLAEGFWQWRLEEYSKSEGTESFDEVFGKLMQYLSTVEEKNKFKSYPVKQQFSETDAVIIESQVYNDIYEPIYGNRIDIELSDESGRKYGYNYITSPGNTRYQIGGLIEGIYRYKSSVILNGKKEEVRGQFLITAQDVELQNLAADFDLMKKLAASTGGKFYNVSQIPQMKNDLLSKQIQATIHSEEKYDALLNLKWVFFALLLLVSVEWFLRKFYGGY